MIVASVVGARPQFVKAAVVSRALAAAGLDERGIHTGQHYDANMSQVFFDELAIPRPAVQLDCGGGNHAEQTAKMLTELDRALRSLRPDRVLVYGDTNSTLAAALAATKRHLPVAHVEAGLRSFNRQMPEEINRVLTDHASDLLFPPTESAAAQLRREGIAEDAIVAVGDVMRDATRLFADLSTDDPFEPTRRHPRLALVTIHRAENVDDPERLRAIAAGLRGLAERLDVVLPVHPRTRKALDTLSADESSLGAVQTIEPLGYLDMLRTVRGADLVVTDSGGLQKEAAFLGTACLTLRTETEWTELVSLGWNRLHDPRQAATVAAAADEWLDAFAPQPLPDALFGDGHASEKVAAALRDRRVATG